MSIRLEAERAVRQSRLDHIKGVVSVLADVDTEIASSLAATMAAWPDAGLPSTLAEWFRTPTGELFQVTHSLRAKTPDISDEECREVFDGMTTETRTKFMMFLSASLS